MTLRHFLTGITYIDIHEVGFSCFRYFSFDFFLWRFELGRARLCKAHTMTFWPDMGIVTVGLGNGDAHWDKTFSLPKEG
jgi:hypothetical protein